MLADFVSKNTEDFAIKLGLNDISLDYIAFALKNGALGFERDLLITKGISMVPQLRTTKDRKVFCKKIKNVLGTEALQLYLAKYDIEFALYLLKHSFILADLDIIKIINHYEPNTEQLQIIISTRKYVSEVISDYIIAKNISSAIYSLLRNPGAVISGQSLCEIFFNNLEDLKLYEIILSRLLKDTRNFKYLLTVADDDIKKKVLEYVFARNKSLILYLPDDASYQAFNFYMSKDHMIKLKQDIDQLFRIKALSPLRIAKYLVQGDVYSFCYAVSRLSDISFTKMKSLFCSEYSGSVFADILTKAGFNYDLKMSIIQLTEFIYISALEDYLTNENFIQQIKKQYTFFVMKYRWDTHKTIEYLFEISDNSNNGS